MLILPSIVIHWEWFLRILIAGMCGAFIGYERRNRNKELEHILLLL